jgi:hypothetical protein
MQSTEVFEMLPELLRYLVTADEGEGTNQLHVKNMMDANSKDHFERCEVFWAAVFRRFQRFPCEEEA